MLRECSVLLLCLVFLAGCAPAKPEPVTVFAMDTLMELTPYGPHGAEAGALAAARLQELDHLLSVTAEDSEIGRINHSGGQPVSVGPDTAALLDAALELGEQTGGALDITVYPLVRAWGFTTDTFRVPAQEELEELLADVDYQAVQFDAEARTVTLPAGTELDLGSVAKGYAGDQVMALFREAGVTSAIINLGGNVQTLGARPDGTLWRVAVQDPFGTGLAGVLEVADRAVVTSGGYERYFEADGERYWHILDPQTGYPARSGIASATVVGESGLLCDGLSTALFILGAEKAEELWRTMGGFDYLLIAEDGSVTITAGIADHFEAPEEGPPRTVTVVTP